MKTIKKVFLTVFTLLLFLTVNGQNSVAEEPFKPMYVTITTAHRNFEVDNSTWIDVEKEFFENVTMKNEYILRSGYYTHLFSPDASEIIQVSVYNSWSDIELAANKAFELAKEAWPDDDARAAYFEKRNTYYTGVYSDEIMASTPYRIEISSESDKPLVFYVRKNLRGNGKSKNIKEYYENIVKKNDVLKGYFVYMHAYGANSSDVMEVLVFNEFSDIDESFKEEQRLLEEYLPYEDKRKEFMEVYRGNFVGHGDFIYQNVLELNK